ncbi:MAG: tetratricopeptide repeat protein [Deltaproteobacteria bacterium]|nr:tetratricopeptide repeat protein [Deltaproteobacteria bacterium]
MNKVLAFSSFSSALLLLLVTTSVSITPPVSSAYGQQTGQTTVSGQNSPVTLISKARSLIEKKNFPVAVRYLTEALKQSPRATEAYLLRGQAFDKMGFPMKALQDLNKYVELRPNDLEGYISRADTNNFNLDHKAAVEDYNRALQLVPDSRPALLGRGIAYAGLENYDLAIRDYETVLSMYPWDHEALVNLGMAFALSGKKESALKSFNKALQVEVDPAWRARISSMVDQISVATKSEKPKPRGPTRSPINKETGMW